MVGSKVVNITKENLHTHWKYPMLSKVKLY